MKKYFRNKSIFFFSLINFILLSILSFSLSQELKDKKKSNPSPTPKEMVILAKNQGYDLTNVNDPFFYDICLPFTSEKNKDVSLFYRQKYYYFPFGKKSKIKNKIEMEKEFDHPIHTKISECFGEYFSFKKLFEIKIFYILIPIFLVQSIILGYLLFGERYKDVAKNTSLEKIKNKSNFLVIESDYCANSTRSLTGIKRTVDENKNKNYFQFISEGNTEENKDNNENKTENKLIEESSLIKTSKNVLVEEQNEDSAPRFGPIINEKNERKINKDKIKPETEKYSNDYNIDELNKDKCFESKLPEIQNKQENIQDNIHLKQNIEKEVLEKSKDNYTFGGKFTFNIDLKKINQMNNKEVEITNDNKTNELNNDKKNLERIDSDLELKNNNISISKNNSKSKYYIKEEYFYFNYLFAYLEDKRTIKEIYCDILNHCQICFLFFNSNISIYESRLLQIVYYCDKILLYFFFHITFLTPSKINKIYDNKSNIILLFLDCILVDIIVIALSEILYFLNNCKKMFIKQKFKINNLRVAEGKCIKIKDFLEQIAFNILYEKLIGFTILSFTFMFLTFKYIFCFYVAYPNSRRNILWKVSVSVVISQTAPFCLSWIPAYLRNKSLQNKKNHLYAFNKIIEKFFIP